MIPVLRWSLIRLAPFEAAIAAIIVVQAVVGFGGWGVVNPIDALLPYWLSLAFNIAYLLAGVSILVGLLMPRGDVEGAGLVLLSGIVIARGVLYGQLLGWQVQAATSLAFALFVASASIMRIAILRLGSVKSDQ